MRYSFESKDVVFRACELHRLKMANRLPAMTYSAPVQDEICELDFGDSTTSVRRKAKYRDYDYDDKSTSRWDILPDILLEDIFSRLTIRERYYASQVCRNWNRIFYSKIVWETFILGDKTLTRRKFNYYMGDQYVLDHHRTQLCLHKVARGFRRLVIKPMENFHNLYEFMTIFSYFCENFESLVLIRTLDFTFGCELSPEVAHGRDKVFGTGGKLLEALKRLMDDLKGLKHLSLQDLLLEKEEAKYLLDDVVYNCGETLKTLKLVNCSKEPYAMLHPVCFVNMHTLTISPQHLGDENILLLANTKLRNLYLLQTKQTENSVPVSFKVWRECSKISPHLRVHHILEGPVEAQILLSRCCPFLDTLIIRDRISTASVLLLASQSRNLRRLVVRRRGMIQKCDWPHNPEWSDSFYNWLRTTSVSIEKTKGEVSRILECIWHPLTEEEFSSYRLQRA
ncbi:f-box domain-containing protein [Nephila pilipes]|uniref:F-box domain-containing protein n=1 Tax=Nephila pilipes TaxID=299642 RepID=A0A8X6PFG7_NEPPI|nr:f-box domain-containing protein [Nephila pilipes]